MHFPALNSSDSLVFTTKSSEETQSVGGQIAHFLKAGDVVCLTGNLGAGKTTLIKGLSSALSKARPEEVTSPTFTYLQTYPGKINIHHFDLYRLSSAGDFLSLGFQEFFTNDAICCIEWPDKLPENLNLQKVFINIEYLSATERQITVRRIHDSK